MSGRGSNINAVFYAEAYHPIQAGSIDGTDILPHDNAVYRALLSSSLYDPSGDPKLIGDPYCTVFVARLSHLTTEESLRKAMSRYGIVKNLRLVRDIVTGASCGYAFVEYETEREMRRAYKDAHHSYVDDSEITVDYSRQQLMPGWIPRRLGGGLGGKKESGQLRFGGRERPFRAPLKSIPYDDLKRLGIPPPPEGRYMSRFQVPSPPRRKWRSMEKEERYHRGRSVDEEECSPENSSLDVEDRRNRISMDREELPGKSHAVEREERQSKGGSRDRSEHFHRRISLDREERHHKKSSSDRDKHHDKRSPGESIKRHYLEINESSHKRSSRDKEGSCKRHRHKSRSDKY